MGNSNTVQITLKVKEDGSIAILGQKVTEFGNNSKRAAAEAKEGFDSLKTSWMSLVAQVYAFKKIFDIYHEHDRAVRMMHTTFKDSADAMIADAQRISDQSKNLFRADEIMQSMARFASGMKRYGIEGQEYINMISRATDVAAGRSMGLEEAMGRLESAMRGEAESAEYLGLTLNDNYMESMAFGGALNDVWGKLTDTEKAQYRYIEMLNQTAEYTAKASEGAQSFEGQIKRLWNTIKDALIPILSGFLIPVLQKSAEGWIYIAQVIKIAVGGSLSWLMTKVADLLGWLEKLPKVGEHFEGMANQARKAAKEMEALGKDGEQGIYKLVAAHNTKLAPAQQQAIDLTEKIEQTKKAAADRNIELIKKEAEATKKAYEAHLKMMAEEEAKAREVMLSIAESAHQEYDSIKEAYQQLQERINPALAKQREYNKAMELLADAARLKLAPSFEEAKEQYDGWIEKTEKEEALKKVQEGYEHLLENIHDKTASTFEEIFQNIGDGWKAFFGNIKDWFIRMLAEMAAQAVSKPIILPIVASTGLLGSSGQAQAAASSGAGGFSATGSPGLEAMLARYTPGLSSLMNYQLVMPTTASYASVAGQMSPMAYQTLASQGMLTQGGLTVGQLGGYGALGSIGYSILGKAIGLPQGQYGGMGAGAGAMGGAYLGAMYGAWGGPIGAAIGAIVGGIASAFIGSNKKRSYLGGDIGLEAIGGADLYKISVENVWGKRVDQEAIDAAESAMLDTANATIDSYRGMYSLLGEDQQQMIDRLLPDLAETIYARSHENLEKRFKSALETASQNIQDALNPIFVTAVNDYIGQIQKDFEGAIGGGESSILGDMFAALPQITSESPIEDIQQVFEGVNEIAKLVTIVVGVIDALAMTNAAFSGTADEAIALSESLTGFAGSLENLQTITQNYYNAFFTDAEKHMRLQEQLTGALADMNIILPGARAGYRALVEGLDLTTEAGQRAYIALMGLAKGADQYYSYIEDQAERSLRLISEEAKRLESERTSLGIQMLKARGDTAAATFFQRLAELQNLDTSLRDLQVAIWRQEDANAAAAKAADEAAAAAAKAEAQERALAEARRRATEQAKAQRKEMLSALLDQANKMASGLRDAYNMLQSARKGMEPKAASAADYLAAQRRLMEVVDQARRGDLSGLQGLGDVIDTITNLSASKYKTYQDYQRDYMRTYSAIAELEKYTKQQLTIAEDIVNAIKHQQDATIALGDKALSTLTSIRAAINELTSVITGVPHYAVGGIHYGGLRLVGEAGPELEYTGPSRIYSASQSGAILNNGELVSELKGFRTESRQENFVLAKHIIKISRIVERWEGDGVPPERAAA